MNDRSTHASCLTTGRRTYPEWGKQGIVHSHPEGHVQTSIHIGRDTNQSEGTVAASNGRGSVR